MCDKYTLERLEHTPHLVLVNLSVHIVQLLHICWRHIVDERSKATVWTSVLVVPGLKIVPFFTIYFWILDSS